VIKNTRTERAHDVLAQALQCCADGVDCRDEAHKALQTVVENIVACGVWDVAQLERELMDAKAARELEGALHEKEIYRKQVWQLRAENAEADLRQPHPCPRCLLNAPGWWRRCVAQHHSASVVHPDTTHEFYCETCERGEVVAS
jgi:hypothetical protein